MNAGTWRDWKGDPRAVPLGGPHRDLVAGGAGFIGQHLVTRLVEQGNDVLVVDNLSSRSPIELPPEADLVIHDIIEPDFGAYGPLVHKFNADTVWNLASPASPPRYMTAPVQTMRTGAEGTRNLLEYARHANAVYVHASTSEIYGDPEIHPQPESYTGNVDIESPRSVYDEAKRYGETLTHTYRRVFGVDTRVARIFNTYGPGMDPEDGRVVTNLLTQTLKDESHTVYGDGTQTRSFCFISDLIEGLIRLRASTTSSPVNLGNDYEITIADLSRLIQSAFGNTGTVFNPLPVSDPTQRKPDISLARDLLGWQPTVNLSDGLTATYEWLASPSIKISLVP